MTALVRHGVAQSDYWVSVHRRTWRAGLVSSLLSPIVYLLAMGAGLGSFLSQARPGSFGTAAYLSFVTPGLLATTAFHVAVSECTFPVMGRFRWHKVYHSMVSTPLRPLDILTGQLVYTVWRVAVTSLAFILVGVIFGQFHSPLVVCAWLVACLLGLSTAAAMCAVASRLPNGDAFTPVHRFVITPLFLLSGAFFPLEELPFGISRIGCLSPVWHGVQLCRGLTLGTVRPAQVATSLSYLVLLTVAAVWSAERGYRKRLVS